MILLLEMSKIEEFKELISSPIIKPSRKTKIFHSTLGEK